MIDNPGRVRPQTDRPNVSWRGISDEVRRLVPELMSATTELRAAKNRYERMSQTYKDNYPDRRSNELRADVAALATAILALRDVQRGGIDQ